MTIHASAVIENEMRSLTSSLKACPSDDKLAVFTLAQPYVTDDSPSRFPTDPPQSIGGTPSPRGNHFVRGAPTALCRIDPIDGASLHVLALVDDRSLDVYIKFILLMQNVSF